MQKELTVAICAYNAAPYIAQTLRSVMEQTLQDFDLLIINDSSTDSTVDIVEQQLLGYEYRVISMAQNSGVAKCRQVALERAQSKYMVFVDADDIILPTMLEDEFRQITSDPQIMGVSSWVKYIDIQGRPIWGGIFIGAQSREQFMQRALSEKLIFFPINTMFDRDAALRVGGFRLNGFPSDMPRYQDFCEDLDLWTRMSDLYSEGRYMVTIPKVLLLYRKSNSGLSSNTIHMTMKMKFVKNNLKLRRAGKNEITYCEFLDSLSSDDIRYFERKVKASYCLRRGVLKLKNFNPLGAFDLLRSMVIKPRYFWQKLRANSIVFKFNSKW